MTIAVGQKLPEGSLTQATAEGPKAVSVADYFGGRKIVLFGVPGAFTPTCNNNHLPGYLENHDALLAKGADAVAVVAVNDPFVMAAWARSTGGEGKIDFLADGSAKFVKSLGLEIDLTERGLGVRAGRFSMIVEDGTVKALNVEDNPGQVASSGATGILEAL